MQQTVALAAPGVWGQPQRAAAPRMGGEGRAVSLYLLLERNFLGKKTNKVVFKNNHGKLMLKDAKLWPELVVHWGTRLFWLSEGHAGPSREAVLLLRTSCRLRV